MIDQKTKVREDALYTLVFMPNYLHNPTFKGYAKSVSSTNVEGPFDILPEHENFVTIIGQRVTIFDLEGKKYDIIMEKGLIEATSNVVKVYVEF